MLLGRMLPPNMPLILGRYLLGNREGVHRKLYYSYAGGAGNKFGSLQNLSVTWGNTAASLYGSLQNLACYPGNRLAANRKK